MRVAVTGGLGFIGSHLAERFVALGQEVVVVDNRSGAVVSHVAGARVLVNDVSAWAAGLPLRAHAGERDLFDLVIHCAAPVGPGAVAQLGGKIAYAIVADTYWLAMACRRMGTPLLNFSSSEVYGTRSTAGYAEDAPVGCLPPYNARKEYGLAKATAECLIANLPNLRHATIRPFNTVGPRQASKKGFVLPTFIEQAKAGVPLTVYEPNARRGFTSVHDLVDFVVTYWDGLVSSTTQPIWNVGTHDNDTSIARLAELVLDCHELHGGTGGWERTDPRERWGDAFAHFLDGQGSKLPSAYPAHELGWKPTRTLADIISEAYDYERNGTP